jgi:hypothetical protein
MTEQLLDRAQRVLGVSREQAIQMLDGRSDERIQEVLNDMEAFAPLPARKNAPIVVVTAFWVLPSGDSGMRKFRGGQLSNVFELAKEAFEEVKPSRLFLSAWASEDLSQSHDFGWRWPPVPDKEGAYADKEGRELGSADAGCSAGAQLDAHSWSRTPRSSTTRHGSGVIPSRLATLLAVANETSRDVAARKKARRRR